VKLPERVERIASLGERWEDRGHGRAGGAEREAAGRQTGTSPS
jgi:hypothetical protein